MARNDKEKKVRINQPLLERPYRYSNLTLVGQAARALQAVAWPLARDRRRVKGRSD